MKKILDGLAIFIIVSFLLFLLVTVSAAFFYGLPSSLLVISGLTMLIWSINRIEKIQ